MRAVVDCNVVVSGLIRPDGASAQILNEFIQGRLEVIVSPAIVEEYRRVLLSRKIRRYIRLSPDEIEGFLSGFALAAFWVEDQEIMEPGVIEDPTDDIYLLAAVEGRADCVVSGDHHLLDFEKYEGIPIVSPRELLNKLG